MTSLPDKPAAQRSDSGRSYPACVLHGRKSPHSGAIWVGMAVTLLVLLATQGSVWAAGAGQEDLDRAMSVKLGARTIGDLTEVVQLVESALEKGLDPGDADFAKSLLAATLIQRGTSLGEAVTGSPAAGAQPVALRATAIAALSDLEKGVKISPKEPQALYLIARLNLATGGDAARRSEALAQAIEYAGDNPPLKAKALLFRAATEQDAQKQMVDLDEAVRVFPDGPDAWRTRGLLRAQLGKPEESLADLDKAIELDPRDAATLEAKAVVLAQLKRYDEALVSLDRAQDLSPGTIRPLLEKAQILGLQENLDAAIHELDRAHELDPKNATVLLLRAAAYRDKGEPDKALADLETALKVAPSLPSAMRLRAVLLADTGKRDEAIAQLEELRQTDPKDLLTLLQLGVLYTAGEKYEKAAEVFSAVLAQQPDEQNALRGRGDALLNLGKHPQAIADYETLLKLTPKDPGTLNNLAWVLATSPDDALRDGKRAVTLATEACELTEYKAAYILSTLAAACAETGDFDTALKWIEKAVEIAEDDEKEAIGKERESYRNRKPWREVLADEKPPAAEPQTEKPGAEEPPP